MQLAPRPDITIKNAAGIFPNFLRNQNSANKIPHTKGTMDAK